MQEDSENESRLELDTDLSLEVQALDFWGAPTVGVLLEVHPQWEPSSGGRWLRGVFPDDGEP